MRASGCEAFVMVTGFVRASLTTSPFATISQTLFHFLQRPLRTGPRSLYTARTPCSVPVTGGPNRGGQGASSLWLISVRRTSARKERQVLRGLYHLSPNP